MADVGRAATLVVVKYSVLLVTALLSSSAAVAHLGQDQFGRFPYVVDGTFAGGGTSWGVVRPDDVFGGWGRVCEESFGPAVTFSVWQPEFGRVLQGGISGVEISTDNGCSWTALDNELAGTFPNAFWQDPNDTHHWLVGTSTIGAENGLWRTQDGGDTWTEVLAPRLGNFFSVAVSDDGTRVAAAGNDGAQHVLLLWSSDGGLTFSDISGPVDARIIVSALAFRGDALVLGGLDASTQGFIDLVRVDEAGDVVVEPVGTTPRQTTHALVFNDTLYVVARNGARGELYRENDSPLGFGVVVDGPTDCLYVAAEQLWGCGKQGGASTTMFVHSADGETWTTDVAFFDVHYRQCPEGTIGATACSTFVETLCGNNTDDDLDGGLDCADDDCRFNTLCAEGEGEGEPAEGEGEGEAAEGEGEQPPGGCTCAGASPAPSLLALVLLRRRRR